MSSRARKNSSPTVKSQLAAEKAARVALVLAASRAADRDSVVIDVVDMDHAIQLTNYSTRLMCRRAASVGESVVDSLLKKADQILIDLYIKNDEKPVALREVYKKMHMLKRQFCEIQETMEERGDWSRQVVKLGNGQSVIGVVPLKR